MDSLRVYGHNGIIQKGYINPEPGFQSGPGDSAVGLGLYFANFFAKFGGYFGEKLFYEILRNIVP